jgi:hypothetical protein
MLVVGKIISEELMETPTATETAWALFTRDHGLKGNPFSASHVLAACAMDMSGCVMDEDFDGECLIEEGESLEIGSWSSVQPDGSFSPNLTVSSWCHPQQILLSLECPEIRNAFRYCKLVDATDEEG